MPTISAQTCITNTGTTSLGGLFTIYTATTISGPFDIFQTNVPLSSLTPPNCPYVMEVDSSTVQIRFVDNLTGCYVDMNVESSDLCETCNIDFTILEQTQTGVLSAGLITGDCQSNITDYFINWYGPDSLTNLAFTSGYGTLFPGYTWTHPLTGTSSVPQYAGTYVPIIEKIRINGITYSLTGGSQNVKACLDCFGSIELSANTCDSGNLISGPYSHLFSFNADSGVGVVPQPVYGTFILSSDTKYFAFAFQGFTIPDRLIMYYSGANYTDLIKLEDINVGSNVSPSTNTLYTTFPKRASTYQFISKVLCLTGLTQSPGDSILFEVIPSSDNTQTSWNLKYKCLDTFDCSLCLFDSPEPIMRYKCKDITFTGGACNTLTITVPFSGCPSDDFYSSDIINYYTWNSGSSALGNTYYLPVGAGFTQFSPNNSLTFGKITCDKVSGGPYIPICGTPSGNTIYFSKFISGSIGNIKITGDNLSNFYTYTNSWYNTINLFNNSVNPLYVNDPEDIGYYKYIILKQPTYPSPTTNCGDGTATISYNIHPSSIFTTATTLSGEWEINITMPTITNEGNWYCCKYGFTADSAVTRVELTYSNCTGGTEVDILIGPNIPNYEFFSDETYFQISASTTGGSYTLGIIECCSEVGCDGIMNQIVQEINSSSTGTSSYFATTIRSSQYTDPFGEYRYARYYLDSITAKTSSSYMILNDYLSKTIPSSGVSNTLLLDLSAQTCDLSSNLIFQNSIPFPIWYRFGHILRYELITPSDPTAFILRALPLDSSGQPINWTPIGPIIGGVNVPPASAFTDTIYIYSAGTVQFSSCTYCYDCLP